MTKKVMEAIDRQVEKSKGLPKIQSIIRHLQVKFKLPFYVAEKYVHAYAYRQEELR